MFFIILLLATFGIGGYYLLNNYFAMISEIIHNYSTGAISFKMLYDFVVFKCRMKSTEIFENGKVEEMTDVNEIIYYLNDTRYRILTPKKTGLRPILRILDVETDSDITDSIREFLGPYGNFHGISTTPKMLNFPQGLKVIYRKGKREIIYGENDVISMNPQIEV